MVTVLKLRNKDQKKTTGNTLESFLNQEETDKKETNKKETNKKETNKKETNKKEKKDNQYNEIYQILYRTGAYINAIDINYHNMLILFLIKIFLNK